MTQTSAVTIHKGGRLETKNHQPPEMEPAQALWKNPWYQRLQRGLQEPGQGRALG